MELHKIKKILAFYMLLEKKNNFGDDDLLQATADFLDLQSHKGYEEWWIGSLKDDKEIEAYMIEIEKFYDDFLNSK